MCVIISLMLSIINLHIYFQFKVFQMQKIYIIKYLIYEYIYIYIRLYIHIYFVYLCMYLSMLNAKKGAVKTLNT